MARVVEVGMSVRIVEPRSLGEPEIDAMYRLYQSYYECVCRERFEHDLRRKHEVIVLERRGRLIGFSTLAYLAIEVHGRAAQLVFSGDTIVTRSCWGRSGLGLAFLFALARRRLAQPGSPLYWFLISKGYKTYLLMANNFAEHYPAYERTTPDWAQAAIADASRRLFGDAYDPRRQLIDFGESRGQLRPHVATPSAELIASHPRVRFFVTANPTWVRGTELPCLARFSLATLPRYAIKRAFRRLQGAA
jgi:hypothetical protein